MCVKVFVINIKCEKKGIFRSHPVNEHNTFINFIITDSKQTVKSQSHSFIIFCEANMKSAFYLVALLVQHLINPFVMGMQHLILHFYKPHSASDTRRQTLSKTLMRNLYTFFVYIRLKGDSSTQVEQA